MLYNIHVMLINLKKKQRDPLCVKNVMKNFYNLLIIENHSSLNLI